MIAEKQRVAMATRDDRYLIQYATISKGYKKVLPNIDGAAACEAYASTLPIYHTTRGAKPRGVSSSRSPILFFATGKQTKGQTYRKMEIASSYLTQPLGCSQQLCRSTKSAVYCWCTAVYGVSAVLHTWYEVRTSHLEVLCTRYLV